MKRLFCFALVACYVVLASASIVSLDISPPGTTAAIGLSPLNEVIPGMSTGSGNEVGDGIYYDTSAHRLFLEFAYGSAHGFSDLTGPAYSWLLHGPARPSETAPAIFDLGQFHRFEIDPSLGGKIQGWLQYTPELERELFGGLQYLNIYTPMNQGGEIRGQLIVVGTEVPEPAEIALLIAALAGIGIAARRLK